MASSPYFSLAVLFVAALGFGLAPLGLAWLWQRVFSPAKPNRIKNAIYECGLESKGDAWVQFHSAYYLYAIMFLIFDVTKVRNYQKTSLTKSTIVVVKRWFR